MKHGTTYLTEISIIWINIDSTALLKSEWSSIEGWWWYAIIITCCIHLVACNNYSHSSRNRRLFKTFH